MTNGVTFVVFAHLTLAGGALPFALRLFGQAEDGGQVVFEIVYREFFERGAGADQQALEFFVAHQGQ